MVPESCGSGVWADKVCSQACSTSFARISSSDVSVQSDQQSAWLLQLASRMALYKFDYYYYYYF